MGLEALEGTKNQNKNKEFIEVTKRYLNFIVSEAIRRKENKMQKEQTENKEIIELTKGYSAIIDAEDYDKVKDYHYFAVDSQGGRWVYACRKEKGKRVWLAYDVLGLSRDEVAKAGLFITYKDGNSLNCSKENLKVSTRSEITTVACNNSSYHDAHYKECVLEPILVMQDMFTKEELIGFLKGNILKYRLRMGHKDNVQKEMDKIKRYEDWLSRVQAGKRIEL